MPSPCCHPHQAGPAELPCTNQFSPWRPMTRDVASPANAFKNIFTFSSFFSEGREGEDISEVGLENPVFFKARQTWDTLSWLTCLLVLVPPSPDRISQSSHISLRTSKYRACKGFYTMFEHVQFPRQASVQHSAPAFSMLQNSSKGGSSHVGGRQERMVSERIQALRHHAMSTTLIPSLPPLLPNLCLHSPLINHIFKENSGFIHVRTEVALQESWSWRGGHSSVLLHFTWSPVSGL